jgi:hypothetical protein
MSATTSIQHCAREEAIRQDTVAASQSSLFKLSSIRRAPLTFGNSSLDSEPLTRTHVVVSYKEGRLESQVLLVTFGVVRSLRASARRVASAAERGKRLLGMEARKLNLALIGKILV